MPNIDINQLKASARGRWDSILSQLGIDVGNGNHKPCPMCGGDDRFRYDNKDGSGSYICGQCGAGFGLDLVMKTRGTDLCGAINIVAEIVGCCGQDEDKPTPPDARRIVMGIWKDCVKIDGTPAEKYLKSRGLMYLPGVLKYCPNCFNMEIGGPLPAMIGPVQNPEGQGVSLHRTYLTVGGEKAAVDKVKMLTPKTKPINGSAIRLFPIEGDTMGVAEGIETAIACMQLFGVPTWSTVSSSIMEGFQPPERVRKIIIYSDNDANFTGQAAAYKLAKRLYNENRIVEVLIPDLIGDFLDVWNREKAK